MDAVNYSLRSSVLEAAYRLSMTSTRIYYRQICWQEIVDSYDRAKATTRSFVLQADPLLPLTKQEVLFTAASNVYISLANDILLLAANSGAMDHGQSAILGKILEMLNESRKFLWFSVASVNLAVSKGVALAEYFRLGEQLAAMDYKAIMADAKPFCFFHEAGSQQLDFNALPYTAFPCPSIRFHEKIGRYLARDRNNMPEHIVHGLGPCVSLLTSLLSPQRSSSVVWVLPPEDDGKSRFILVAGRHFDQPTLINVKNSNDKALFQLLERARVDKASGRQAEDCGWLKRTDLWPCSQQDAVSHAWTTLTRLAAPLGEFEFIRSKKKGLKQPPRGGECRIPKALTGDDCALFHSDG